MHTSVTPDKRPTIYILPVVCKPNPLTMIEALVNAVLDMDLKDQMEN